MRQAKGGAMELGLSGKVALVTGASRGIGQGIALSLADEGCDLLLTGRDEAALKAVAAEIKAKGRKAAISVLDLRKEGTEKPLVEAVRREFGRLDILVNNAGATKRGDFFKLTNADWADGFALKFFAHVRLTREAWPMLKAQQRLAGHHRRHRRQGAGGAVHHRQLGQRRLRRLHQGDGRHRQDRRRAGQFHQSRPRRDRAAVAALPRDHEEPPGATRTRCARSTARSSASAASARSRTWAR